jgi:hypothetical protein
MRRFRTHSCRKKVGGYKIFCPGPERASTTPSRARSRSSITGWIDFDYVETNSAGCRCRHAHPDVVDFFFVLAKMGSNASCQDVRILKGIFAVEEFDGVAADADVCDLVSLFSGVGEDVAGPFHFDALFDVDGSCGRR